MDFIFLLSLMIIDGTDNVDYFIYKFNLSKKVDTKLIKMIEIFKKKEMPVIPFKANTLMEKYQVPEGRELGQKLKVIEEVWTSNDFKISDKEVQKIVSN